MRVSDIKFAELLQALAQGRRVRGVAVADLLKAAIDGELSQEQLGAFLMGVACRGLDREGLAALVRSYIGSTQRGEASGRTRTTFFDKHSTGGVGDKLTLLVLPLAAAAGVCVRKLSGTSLGHCRGTIDKLSALPNFRHVEDLSELTQEAEKFGFSIGRTSPDLCPGDRITYNTRNLCGTVQVPDLIAASIMSKKIALAPAGLILDVKLGSGGLFDSTEIARHTAHLMMDIAAEFELPARTFLTRMDTPLGRAVGGLCEVCEAIDLLETESQATSVADLSITFASALVQMQSGVDADAANAAVMSAWNSGEAHLRLVNWLQSRGVNVADLRKLRTPSVVITSNSDGWVCGIDARRIGELSASLAAAGGPHNPGLGDIEILQPVGSRVHTGVALARIAARTCDHETVASSFRTAVTVGPQPPSVLPAIIEVIDQTPVIQPNEVR